MSYSSNNDIKKMKEKRNKAMNKKNKVSTVSILINILQNHFCNSSMVWYIGILLLCSPCIYFLLKIVSILPE